jgi:raffinose/stachyose/melibiose transport system permease protein
MNSDAVRHRNKLNLSKLFQFVSLFIATFIILFPIYTIAVGSFKTKEEYLKTSKFSLPDSFFNFENFLIAFDKGRLGLGFYNTAIIILIAVAGNVLLGTMVAFALGRFNFKLKSLIMGLYLAAAVIPLVTTQVATFSIIKAIGLYNTIWAPIVLYLGADVLQIVIYLQFINSIPKDLDESAMIEGASLFKIYRSVIFPLLAPATATVIILKTIAIYKDFYIPYLYMPSRDLQVVSTAIFAFVGPFAASWHIISAAIVLIFIPTAVLYLFLQRYIFSGVTSGSVK